MATREELLARTGDLFAWLSDGRLRVQIDQAFPMRAAAEAQQYLESRCALGKVRLTVE